MIEQFLRWLFNSPKRVWRYDCPEHQFLSNAVRCPRCIEVWQ